ncbi:hypothetical protein TI05_17750, partial [Achromatium sp. WMS3]
MFAIRQIIDNPKEVVSVPPEMRHRPTEVIFIAIESNQLAIDPDPISKFCGSGIGGSTARLLAERQT